MTVQWGGCLYFTLVGTNALHHFFAFSSAKLVLKNICSICRLFRFALILEVSGKIVEFFQMSDTIKMLLKNQIRSILPIFSHKENISPFPTPSAFRKGLFFEVRRDSGVGRRGPQIFTLANGLAFIS